MKMNLSSELKDLKDLLKKDSSTEIRRSCRESQDTSIDDIEEGEILEDFEEKTICRFYQTGQCVSGKSCRYLHVTDKGLYRMFDSPVYAPPPCQFQVPNLPFAREIESPDTSETQTEWDRALQDAAERLKCWDIVARHGCMGKLRVTLERGHGPPETDKCSTPSKLTSVEELSPPETAISFNRRKLSHDSCRTSKTPEKKKKDLRLKLSANRLRNETSQGRKTRSRSSKKNSPGTISLSSCGSSNLQDWYRSQRRRRRHRKRHHDRSSYSVSSSRSSPPLLSVSKRVSVRIGDRQVHNRKKDYLLRPERRHKTKYYRLIHSSERDIHPRRRSRSPLASRPKKHSNIGSVVLPLFPPMSCSEKLKLGMKKFTTVKDLAEDDDAKIDRDSTKTKRRWIPKKVFSPLTDRSCRDMSISPLSDSSERKMFVVSGELNSVSREVYGPAYPPAISSVCKKGKELKFVAGSELKSVSKEVYGPAYPSESSSMGKIDKEPTKKRVDALEKNLQVYGPVCPAESSSVRKKSKKPTQRVEVAKKDLQTKGSAGLPESSSVHNKQPTKKRKADSVEKEYRSVCPLKSSGVHDKQPAKKRKADSVEKEHRSVCPPGSVGEQDKQPAKKRVRDLENDLMKFHGGIKKAKKPTQTTVSEPSCPLAIQSNQAERKKSRPSPAMMEILTRQLKEVQAAIDRKKGGKK